MKSCSKRVLIFASEWRNEDRNDMSIVPTSDIREALERCTGPFYIPGWRSEMKGSRPWDEIIFTCATELILVMENMDFVWMIRGLHGMILLESVCSIDPRMFVRVFIVYRCLTFNMNDLWFHHMSFRLWKQQTISFPFLSFVWPKFSTGQKWNTKKLNWPVCGGINHWMFLGFLDALEIQSPSANGNGT